jgi:hypothetical protein
MIPVGSRFDAFVLAIAFGAVACVPGYQVSEGGEPKQISGRLGGQAPLDEFANGCIWLTGLDGQRTPLLVMGEAVVQFQPLRLVDTAGRVIAAEGDTITAIGPTMAIGENGCAPIDDMFVVDELIGPRWTWRDPVSIRWDPDSS